MLSVTRTLDQLIDAALAEVARYDERGYQVVVGSDALTASSSDTTCTIDNGSRLGVSDVIEFGSELVLVTAISSDPTPILTVSRGYDGSTVAAHATGTTGVVNPMFARKRVAVPIVRAFARMEAKQVFNVVSVTVYRVAGKEYAVLPADCRDVLRVAYMDSYGRFEPNVDGWRFFDDIPVSIAASGRIIRLARFVMDTDQLIVTYRAPYRWTSYPNDPTGTDTIVMPESTQDLPSMYAVAWLTSGREISRQDLDRSEEWNRSQQVTNGISTGLIRQKWQEFYQAVDDARRLYVADIPRPFERKRRFN